MTYHMQTTMARSLGIMIFLFRQPDVRWPVRKCFWRRKRVQRGEGMNADEDGGWMDGDPKWLGMSE